MRRRRLHDHDTEEAYVHRSLILALAWLVTACDRAPEITSPAPTLHIHGGTHHTGPLSPEVKREVVHLRKMTAPFHDFQAAAEAGWETQITGCFSDPALGGMGYHYGNTALIDGTVEAFKPELLLYEPDKNGRLRFVAVEYIVPFAAWTAAEPPKVHGQSFHRNEAFGLWVLHVWHVRKNPDGVFADWNPKVSCRFATR